MLADLLIMTEHYWLKYTRNWNIQSEFHSAPLAAKLPELTTFSRSGCLQYLDRSHSLQLQPKTMVHWCNWLTQRWAVRQVLVASDWLGSGTGVAAVNADWWLAGEKWQKISFWWNDESVVTIIICQLMCYVTVFGNLKFPFGLWFSFACIYACTPVQPEPNFTGYKSDWIGIITFTY